MMSERQMADSLRKCVVDFLNSHKETIAEISLDLPFLLDEKVGVQYASVEERLQASHMLTLTRVILRCLRQASCFVPRSKYIAKQEACFNS